MKKLLLIIAFMFAIATAFLGCKQDPQGIDTLPLICFDRQIQPIFTGNCTKAGCHSSGSGELSDYTYYGGVMTGVTPGNPNKSIVYTVTTSTWGFKMPPKGNNQLNEEQRTLIYMWIKQGATDTVTCK